MIFELKENKNKFLESAYKKAMKELNEYFGIVWKIDMPNIILLDSRKKIDDLLQEKSPLWLIAWADDKNIFMLKGKKYKTESSHTYSKKDFYKTLKHELCHMYFHRISKKVCFDRYMWLQEGTAYLISKQINLSQYPKIFSKFLSQYSEWNGKSYYESGFAVQLLVEKFGRKKLISLIKSLSEVKSEKDFNKEFEKVYGKKPTYKFFNGLLEEKNDKI
jgi:hypothetical protein